MTHKSYNDYKEEMDMLIVTLRVLIIIAMVLVIYTLVQYFRSPYRKLKKSIRQGVYFLLDEPDNPKKNILLTYKGCLFEVEKYIGTKMDALCVVNIDMFDDKSMDLKRITIDDITFLEVKLTEAYPHAQIEWIHPINTITGVPSE